MISGLHHYALEVPDLAVAEGFLQDFGLETGEKDGSLVAQCPGRDQEQVRLVQAPAKRLHHVSFTLRPGTLDSVLQALERASTPVIEPPPSAAEEGLWVRDPDGTAVQLLDGEPAPARSARDVLFNVGGTRQRIGVPQWQQITEDVMPRRLGHTLLFTAQPQEMTAFYTQVLGLRVSDRIRGLVTFLNAGPGDHHIFGFIASTHRGFHHASFEVPSIDAIAIGADRMRARGREPGWGLGRHTIMDRVVLRHRPDQRLLGGPRLGGAAASVGRAAAGCLPGQPGARRLTQALRISRQTAYTFNCIHPGGPGGRPPGQHLRLDSQPAGLQRGRTS